MSDPRQRFGEELWDANNFELAYNTIWQERMKELEQIPGYLESTTGNAPVPPLAAMYTAIMVAPARRLFSWAVPSTEAIHCIHEAAPGGVVEIGAGTGYWAHLLRLHGTAIAAYDIHPTDGSERNGHHAVEMGSDEFENAPPFTEVEQGVPEVAAEHPQSALLLCWPPREEPEVPSYVASMAARALQSYRGDTVLYIGEYLADRENGGMTAGPVFHDRLKKWGEMERSVELPQWPNARDSLMVWRRGMAHSALVGRNRVAELEVGQQRQLRSGEAEKIRQSALASQRMAWENAATAQMLTRANNGGAKPRNGLERNLVEAVRARAPWWQRLLLRGL
ncbi:hypothetical protein CYMTET_48742 [Cymbomonas tetramitiformis]|uniref:Uncharacterized protein n=1 Tax=Cymbomonas tetramitiformis TaxID=36881 RepID=A0AAE0EUU3_9CHLO|nr:hypothetical protein CYMTET_48742 [Cymbomonas tetramitiformis]